MIMLHGRSTDLQFETAFFLWMFRHFYCTRASSLGSCVHALINSSMKFLPNYPVMSRHTFQREREYMYHLGGLLMGGAGGRSADGV